MGRSGAPARVRCGAAPRYTGSMRAHLVAVQAALHEERYVDEASFASWVGELGRRALESVPDRVPGEPVLLAYPEAIGMPLLLTVGVAPRAAGSRTLARAAARLARRRWRAVLAAAWRHRVAGPAALHLAGALPAYRAYVGAFSAVARATGATVVAGSAFLPPIARHASGPAVAAGKVFNVSYVFGPGGTVLGRSRKAFLTPGAESHAGLSRGRVEEQRAFATPVGRLGVAVCLDGWVDAVLRALDADGAEIVVQPSANDAPWERAWPREPHLTEGEAWLERGLRAGIQGRASLRYGVNPMMVGEIFGFRPRGRSSIVANAALVSGPWIDGREGMLALAPDPAAEAVLGVSVPLPGSADEGGSTGARRPAESSAAGGTMRS